MKVFLLTIDHWSRWESIHKKYLETFITLTLYIKINYILETKTMLILIWFINLTQFSNYSELFQYLSRKWVKHLDYHLETLNYLGVGLGLGYPFVWCWWLPCPLLCSCSVVSLNCYWMALRIINMPETTHIQHFYLFGYNWNSVFNIFSTFPIFGSGSIQVGSRSCLIFYLVCFYWTLHYLSSDRFCWSAFLLWIIFVSCLILYWVCHEGW